MTSALSSSASSLVCVGDLELQSIVFIRRVGQGGYRLTVLRLYLEGMKEVVQW